VEYVGIEFALIFIAEYRIILFICYIILFIFRTLLYSRIFVVKLCFIMILVIYMRDILSRIRYDESICWKIILSFYYHINLLLVFRIKLFIVVI